MCLFFFRINLRTLGRCVRPAIPQSRGETHHCYHFSFLYLRVKLWLPNLNEDSSIARSRDARGTKERNAGRGQSFRRQQASKFPRNYDASLTQRACRDELGPLDPLTTQFPLPRKRKIIERGEPHRPLWLRRNGPSETREKTAEGNQGIVRSESLACLIVPIHGVGSTLFHLTMDRHLSPFYTA